MRIGVVTFPGSLDDRDAARAIRIAGGEAIELWHGDADLHGVDAVVLPGGFSYGDYLRCGAIARFAPVMGPLVAAANGGLPVLGICNGFQVLCEALTYVNMPHTLCLMKGSEHSAETPTQQLRFNFVLFNFFRRTKKLQNLSEKLGALRLRKYINTVVT